MNIAFPALFVLLLLLPGVLLSYSYRRGFFQRSPVTLGPIRDEIGRGIVLALIIHPISLVLVDACGGWAPSTTVFLSVFAEMGDVETTTVARQLEGGLWYLVGVNLAAAAIGGLIHGGIRWWNLDLRYDRLRFSNEWHYLFSGEARVFKVDEEERTVASIRKALDWDFEFVFVSVVVTMGEGPPVLYWGVLSDYFFDESGRLEKIVLEGAQRRSLLSEEDRPSEPGAQEDAPQAASDMPPESERFYAVRGAYLVIRYENVQTLNVEYMVFDEE
jgi:hypothetical protein